MRYIFLLDHDGVNRIWTWDQDDWHFTYPEKKSIYRNKTFCSTDPHTFITANVFSQSLVLVTRQPFYLHTSGTISNHVGKHFSGLKKKG